MLNADLLFKKSKRYHLQSDCDFGQMTAELTLKHRETHGCIVSTVATDALVLKHQAISILSTD